MLSNLFQTIQNNQSQSMPQQDPLAALRDIHLPAEISLFPSAPGWWILFVVIFTAITYLIYRIYQYQKAIRLLKPARIEIQRLRSIEPQQLNAHSIAKLSILLKRICLVYYPKQLVASLNGQAWFDFLNQQKTFFSNQDLELFNKTAYQAKPKIEQQHWLSILNASEKYIESTIKIAARKRRGSQ